MNDCVVMFIIFLAQFIKGTSMQHIFEKLDDNTLVNANVGTILGRRAADGNYTMFTGIPYADVDLSNPFGLSTPHAKFTEPFEAYSDSVICPQASSVSSSVDCLQLNVYVPDSTRSSNPKPVMVWIHGGAFMTRSANRESVGPAFLMKHDIIMVSINYRLGPYGFMCLGTPQVPGNQGLKDQLLGLRWVKENIEYFGGDPNKITLAGQSAGAFSVHLHLLSPHDALFDRIILNSGSGLLNELINDADITAPVKMAQILGLNSDDVNESLVFLANQDVSSILRASDQVDYRFWPCLETSNEIVDRFITDFPINQAATKIEGKSVLQGVTSDEWISMYANMTPEDFADITVFRDFMELHFSMERELLDTVLKIVENYYLGGRGLSQETIYNITNYHSDVVFNHPAHRAIPYFLGNGASEIYFYKFSYIGERNYDRKMHNLTFGGAAHNDELGYLFDMPLIFPDEPNSEDQMMVDRVTLMWSNFVKYGNPTPETSSLLPVKWEPIVSGDTVYKYLDIDSELTIHINPFNERMAFWDLVYEAYGEYERGLKTNLASSIHRTIFYFGILLSILVSM